MQKDFKISNYYYFIVFIGYALTLFLTFMRPGVLGALLMVLIFISLIYKGLRSNGLNNTSKSILNIIRDSHLLDIVVSSYLLYNFLSVIWLTHYGYPVSVYTGELVSSILPIVFYFVARSGDENRNDYYKWFLYSILFIGIISILLYAIAPQFYCDYLFNWSYISKADAQTARVRMESVTGSTTLSYLGVAAMCVSSFFIFSEETKKSKKIFPLFMFFFSVVIVFMTNGRAGMVAAILVVLFLNYIVIFKLKILGKKFFYIEVIAIVAGILLALIAMPSVAMKIWARLVSLPGAVGQRSEQWIAAANNMKGAWLGNGLGANGHRALTVEGAHVVADGGLVKLFCEEGSVGFGLFAYVMLVIFIKGFKKVNDLFAEFMIIGTALLMSIGSNIIAFQLCAPIFWYAIGVVASRVILDEKVG